MSRRPCRGLLPGTAPAAKESARLSAEWPGARRLHPDGPDSRAGMRPGGRVMPRGDGRPYRRLQYATLEGGGRRRRSTLLDRRQVAGDHWCTGLPLPRTPNSACAPTTRMPPRPWTFGSSWAESSGGGPGAPWVPRPAPPPAPPSGCGWCPSRRPRPRGCYGTAPPTRSTPSVTVPPTGRSCRPASASPSCPTTRSSSTTSTCRTPGVPTWQRRWRGCRQLSPTVSPYVSSTWTGRSPSSWASRPRP
jgi:hypothetical protein